MNSTRPSHSQAAEFITDFPVSLFAGVTSPQITEIPWVSRAIRPSVSPLRVTKDGFYQIPWRISADCQFGKENEIGPALLCLACIGNDLGGIPAEIAYCGIYLAQRDLHYL